MATKYKVQVIKHGYAINRREYFTVELTEVPIIRVSRSTKKYQEFTTGLRRSVKQTYFPGQPLFDIIKNRHEQQLPIFIRGEIITVYTPFEFVIKCRDQITHKKVPVMTNRINLETGKYSPTPVTSNSLPIFIDERNLTFKDLIINKVIKQKEKDRTS